VLCPVGGLPTIPTFLGASEARQRRKQLLDKEVDAAEQLEELVGEEEDMGHSLGIGSR
jgi:hypothetical protein